MKSVSMLEFRKNAEKVIRKVQRGQRIVLTYRGKDVLRLEPILDEDIDENDPFYRLYEQSDDTASTLSNEEMDATIYES